MSKILNNFTEVRLFFSNHGPIDAELKNVFEVVRSVCWHSSGQQTTRIEDLEGNDVSKEVKSQINAQFRGWIKS